MKYLYSKIDINAQNKDGYTELMLAIRYITDIEQDRFYYETTSMFTEIIQYLKDTIDINIQNNDGNTALMIAILYDKYKTITQSLFITFTDTIDIGIQNNDGNTALMLAAKHKNVTIIQYLCDKLQPI